MDTIRKHWLILGAALVVLWFAYGAPYRRYLAAKRKFQAEHPDERFPLQFSLLQPFLEAQAPL